MNFISKILLVLVFFGFISSCKKDESIPSQSHIEANDFLSDKKYKQLVIDVNYMGNYKPTDDALIQMENFLKERLKKPKGIKVNVAKIPTLNKASYSLIDVKLIEQQHRKAFSSKDVVAAYVLFLDGNYSNDNGNSKSLGIAYGNTSAVIFQKTVHQFSGGVTQPKRSVLEATVINHEFGHLLGLVNNGSSMHSPHQDVDHGHHCDNQDCLMYYTSETSDVVSNLINNNIPTLDANCINDLRKNGGK